MQLLNKDLENYTLREEQAKCSNYIFDTIENNKNIKFFLLDIPTGVGKSVLALNIIQRYIKEVDKDVNFDIITESKILQNQYIKEFNSISNLWGRNTYQCEQFNCSCEEGKEFQKISKSSCDDCPYDKDRENYMNGKISLTNFHMYTLMRMNKLFDQRESKVLIVDEAHQLESIVSDFISITISQGILEEIFDDHRSIMDKMKTIRNIEDFAEYCNSFLAKKIERTINILEIELKKTDEVTLKRDLQINDILGTYDETIEIGKTKILQKLKSLEYKVYNFLTEYKREKSNWVLQNEKDERGRDRTIIQPIWAAPFFDKYIWSRYDKVFLMSGTILDEITFARLNGIPKEEFSYYNIDSPFLVKNRPIYYFPTGKMNYRTKEETFKKQIPLILKLLNKYKNKKGIIHTVNFELSNWVRDNIKDDRLIFHTSKIKSKNFAIKQHFTSKKPTILVSPSMGTGLDLKDELGRFQILLKVPYPHMGDDRTKKRMASDPGWYSTKVVQSIIQIYGRGVRNMDDYADLLILDSCFSDVLSYNQHLFPNWVLQAIKQVNKW